MEYRKVQSNHSPGWTKSDNISAGTAGRPDDIRTQDLPDTKRQC